jgi:hypothetical protein
MLFRLKTLGCTKIVQTKCDSVETIENIESEFGGASRDRTDDLIVANDGVRQIISFACLHLVAEYGPLRSNSTNKFQACPGKLPQQFFLPARSLHLHARMHVGACELDHDDE